MTSEALDFKPFSALLCRRGLCLWHRMDSWRGAKHLHKAHNETIPKCRFAEKPCAASIFAKRKRLIVSDTLVSKLSTLFLVEMGRIELPSESISTGTSPGADGHLHSLVRAQTVTLTDLVASLYMVRSKLCALTFTTNRRPVLSRGPLRRNAR